MFEEDENQALDTEEENGGQGEVVDTQEEGEEDGSAESAGERAEETGDAGREQQRTEQTHEDNAAARAARIRAEQETTQRLQRQFDEQIAGMGVPNPYTGKPFGSFAEFREYGQKYRKEQLETEARTKGTTVEALEEERENKAFLARKRKEEKERLDAAEDARKKSDFLRTDLEVFLDKYPDVDPAKLEQNQAFRKFAGDRMYRVPLSELYGDFSELVGDVKRSAVEKASARQERSTGGGQGGGTELLTTSQRTALDEWNRENPDMKMTPKEFMGR